MVSVHQSVTTAESFTIRTDFLAVLSESTQALEQLDLQQFAHFDSRESSLMSQRFHRIADVSSSLNTGTFTRPERGDVSRVQKPLLPGQTVDVELMIFVGTSAPLKLSRYRLLSFATNDELNTLATTTTQPSLSTATALSSLASAPAQQHPALID